MQRLVDFGKTASSKLTVDEFNKIDLEEEADPPSFTKARQRAKQAQIYDETVKYASPDLLAQLASTQERVEAVLAKRKAIEEDIASRATILPSREERKKMLKSRLPILSLNIMQAKSSKSEEDSGNDCVSVSKQNHSNNEVKASSSPAKHSTMSFMVRDLDKSESVSQEELNEKELLDTIELFNETQHGIEIDDEGDEDDDDDIEDSSKQENYTAKEKEGMNNLLVCFCSFVFIGYFLSR